MKSTKILVLPVGVHRGATTAIGAARRAPDRSYDSQRVSKEICMRIKVLPFVLSSPQCVSKEVHAHTNASHQ